MALMARSIEMSFSASRPRRALRSMSIGSLLVCACAQVRAVHPAQPTLAQPTLAQPTFAVVQRSELDLYPSPAEFGVAELPALSGNVEPHPVGVRPGDPSRDSLRSSAGARRGMGL